VEAELRTEAAARVNCELEAAQWGRQVALLQAQLREAASLLESTDSSAPDNRLRAHLHTQQLQQQVASQSILSFYSLIILFKVFFCVLLRV